MVGATFHFHSTPETPPQIVSHAPQPTPCTTGRRCACARSRRHMTVHRTCVVAGSIPLETTNDFNHDLIEISIIAPWSTMGNFIQCISHAIVTKETSDDHPSISHISHAVVFVVFCKPILARFKLCSQTKMLDGRTNRFESIFEALYGPQTKILEDGTEDEMLIFD